MKTTTNTMRCAVAAGLLGLALALPAAAQMGPGGGGPGAWCGGAAGGAAGGPAAGWGCGGGAGGPGAGGWGCGGGRGRGPGMGMRFGPANTAGWSMMTPEEHAAHRARMFAATSYAECKAVTLEQHKLVEARAKERGVTLPAIGADMCDRLQARGILK